MEKNKDQVFWVPTVIPAFWLISHEPLRLPDIRAWAA
jgi:hypothetical protein